jgi:hypothetical protein
MSTDPNKSLRSWDLQCRAPSWAFPPSIQRERESTCLALTLLHINKPAPAHLLYAHSWIISQIRPEIFDSLCGDLNLVLTFVHVLWLFFQPESHCTAEAGFELVIILSQHPEGCEHGYMPPYPVPHSVLLFSPFSFFSTGDSTLVLFIFSLQLLLKFYLLMYFFPYCCAGWEYIVAFTKVLTVHRTHHTWIHPFHCSPLPPPFLE